MTTQSVFSYVIWASIGAFIVLIGLLMEHFSDKKINEWYDNFTTLKWGKKINWLGCWAVIIGVAIELGIGIIFAIDAYRNNPLNKRVSDLRVTLSFAVKGTYSSDLKPSSPVVIPAEGGISMVWLEKQDISSNGATEISNNVFIDMIRSPASMLFATKYDRIGVYYGKPNSLQPEYIYSLEYKWTPYEKYFYSKAEHNSFKVGETYNDVNSLLICVGFLPRGVEFIDGVADLTINDIHKPFYVIPYAIPKQYGSDTNNLFTYFFASDIVAKPEPFISKLTLCIAYGIIVAGILWMCFGWIFFQKHRFNS